MAEKLEIYKCEACGNIVEVIHGGGGELVCCGEAMKKMVENTVDAAKEKHVRHRYWLPGPGIFFHVAFRQRKWPGRRLRLP